MKGFKSNTLTNCTLEYVRPDGTRMIVPIPDSLPTGERMSTFTTAQDLNKLTDDIAAAKRELGQSSIERESARTLLLLERVVGIVESLDERTRAAETKLKRLEGDGK